MVDMDLFIGYINLTLVFIFGKKNTIRTIVFVRLTTDSFFRVKNKFQIRNLKS